MTDRDRKSATGLLTGWGLALACLLFPGCHRLGSHDRAGMYTPSHSRDQDIRKKAANDPFAAEGQPVQDALPVRR